MMVSYEEFLFLNIVVICYWHLQLARIAFSTFSKKSPSQN